MLFKMVGSLPAERNSTLHHIIYDYVAILEYCTYIFERLFNVIYIYKSFGYGVGWGWGVSSCFSSGSYAAACSTARTSERFFHFFHFWQDWWPWPIDYLIRLWTNFQGQIWNLLYLSQKWCDWHEMKSKHINWTLGLKCDRRIWPWP